MTTLAQRFNLGDLARRLTGGRKADGADLPIRDWNQGPQGSAATRIAGFDAALVWCVWWPCCPWAW